MAPAGIMPTPRARARRVAAWVVFALVATLGVWAGVRSVVDRIDRHVKDSRSGPMHVFSLATVPPFLTEEIALAKAREALARDGLDVERWRPHADDRSKAPDGKPDRHLVRNVGNPNDGWILFVYAPPATGEANETAWPENPTRIVRVELIEGRVHCQVILPK